MSKELIEMQQIRELTRLKCHQMRVEELVTIRCQGRAYPVTSFIFGSNRKDVPTLGLFGGVHGLERIGTHVITAFLRTLIKQLQWDTDLQNSLKKARIVSIPLINPGGMHLHWRSNPNGVDLMRNAPVDVDRQAKRRPWLVSGHRISNKLAWYRGDRNKMEVESQALN